MKVLLNRHWNRLYINCNDKVIKINDIIYPIYDNYSIEEVTEFEENSKTKNIEDDTNLFGGTQGEYIYLQYMDNNTLELWGTDGKGNGLDCYAKFKDGAWSVLI